MNQIIVLLCILGIALGDVSRLSRSGGYHYDRPSIAFELPTDDIIASTVISRPPPPPQRTGYNYNPPQRVYRPTYTATPQVQQYSRTPVHQNRKFVTPIAAPQQQQQRYYPAVSHQHSYVAPIAVRPTQRYRERVPYRQAYVQPSVYRPPQSQPQRSYGPPPDPYAYSPPARQFVSAPQPQSRPPQRTYSQSSYVEPAAVSAGSFDNDGYHYDRPSVPFVSNSVSYAPAEVQIPAGPAFSSVPSVQQISAGALQSDGYHYDRPQNDFEDNGLHYRKIRRVIYRYKKK